MKIVKEETIIRHGKYAASDAWNRTRKAILKAIKKVEWPPGSGSFTIYPESGKKRGMGNGVTPIKRGLMIELKRQGWEIEGPAKNALGHSLGDFDAVLDTKYGPVILEWETGNISSSHRSLNKMTMLLSTGIIAAGMLIVPSTEFARWLTDRIGNIRELEPYLGFWKSVPCEAGILEIFVIEHDATSKDVPKIPKGTGGRALG